MKILLAIAYYGTKNRPYLDRVLATYKAMPHEVHPVIFSECPKDLGPDVEVIAGVPTDDPWSLPFGHKKLFADRIDQYDLFIYSEDDILITQKNVEAFLEVSKILPPDEIPGFLRTEQTPDGKISFPEAAGYFHWVPGSLRKRGSYDLAVYSCPHAGCYILTREHLKKAIASGGFVVAPYETRYDLAVTAATDPYTQCGFTKLVCISNFADFLVPHLSNRYAGLYGLSTAEMQSQLDEMQLLRSTGQRQVELIPTPETSLPRLVYSKNYYEPVRKDMLSLLPDNARNILSVGCGTGETESYLIQHGCKVTAVPIDPIIAAIARNKGVQIVSSDLHVAVNQLQNERFDCVLFTGVLHLCSDPVAMLKTIAQLLGNNAVVIASAPNLNHHKALLGRLRGKPGFKDVGDFKRTGIHKTTHRQLRGWFAQAGLSAERTMSIVPDKHKWMRRLGGPIGAELAALEIVCSARCRNAVKATQTLAGAA